MRFAVLLKGSVMFLGAPQLLEVLDFHKCVAKMLEIRSFVFLRIHTLLFYLFLACISEPSALLPYT